MQLINIHFFQTFEIEQSLLYYMVLMFDSKVSLLPVSVYIFSPWVRFLFHKKKYIYKLFQRIFVVKKFLNKN
jgi:hypothetical protein